MPDAPSATQSLRLEILSSTGAAARIVQSNIPDELKSLFPAGAVMEVRVASDQNGQRGIVYQGQFIPAAVPGNIPDGDALVVKVLDNQDQLVLKILGADDIKKLLEELLPSTPYLPKNPLPSGMLDSVRNLVQNLIAKAAHETSPAPVPKELAQILFQEPAGPPAVPEIVSPNIPAKPQSGGSVNVPALSAASAAQLPLMAASPAVPATPAPAPVESSLPKAFESLFRQNFIAGPESFKDSQRLAAFLIESGGSGMLTRVAEAKCAVEQLIKDSIPASPPARIVAALKEALQTLVSSPASLSFEDQSQNPPVSFAQKLYVEASAMILGQAISSRGTAELLQANLPQTRANPLVFLLTTLTSMSFFKGSDIQPGATTLDEMLTAVISELQRLRDTKAPDREIRHALTRALQQLDGKSHPPAVDPKAPQIPASVKAGLIRGMDSVLGSRESLSQLNPLMQSAGQPVMMLFPSIIEGILSRWEMVYRPRQQEIEQDGSRKKKNSSNFEHVSLSIPLPSFGDVQIEIARKTDEVLVHFTFSRSEITEFVREQIPRLEQSVKAAGYSRSSVHARTGQPQRPSADWIRQLVEGLAIA